MKWAIDKVFEHHLVKGWVAANDGDNNKIYKVSIRTPEKIVYQAKANLDRPDVKAAKLHATGLCGFSFNAEQSGIREGDLLLVELSNEERTEHYTQSFLYTTTPDTIHEFEKLEVARNDFSIMEKKTSSILNDYPHWIALKILLIRLRRNKRAKGWRGEFTGVYYEHKESDWELFYNIVSTYREAILNNLSTRNLFSITDTIADFSTPLERCASQCLSMFMFHERFSQTLNPLSKEDNFININTKSQHIVWDGMLTNKLDADDSLDIYLTRTYENLQNTPLILNFFQIIIIKAMSESNSIFYRNLKYSPYFSEAWEFYLNKFNNDLIKSFGNINTN